jgi:PDZ domain-containing protein
MTLRFSRTPRFIKVILVLAFIVPLFTPMNFVVLQPGQGTALFPKVLTVKSSDAKTYKPTGEAYLLAIWVSTPDAKVLGAEVLGCWVRADCVVFPRSVIYKRHTSSKAEDVAAKREMKVSQSDALTAAKKFLAMRYPAIDTSRLSDSSITVDLPDTGGPSGGFIFSLGLVELLTPEDLLQGRKIAGSGTIAADGSVGAIGGIAEKVIAAKKAGATLLFASQSNCDEIPKKVQGITIVAISNLSEAVDYLKQPISERAAGLTGCTNLGV